MRYKTRQLWLFRVILAQHYSSEKPFNTQTELGPSHQKAVTVRLIFIKRWGKKRKKSDKLRLKNMKKKRTAE
jgi:hypothetical protein